MKYLLLNLRYLMYYLIYFCSIFEVFQKSFVFWFNVSEDIYSHPQSETISKLFESYVEHLIECLCKHCRLPPNHVCLSIVYIFL